MPIKEHKIKKDWGERGWGGTYAVGCGFPGCLERSESTKLFPSCQKDGLNALKFPARSLSSEEERGGSLVWNG